LCCTAEGHGIFDIDIKNQPLFQQIVKNFATWLSGSDFEGNNSGIPMLIEEFNRVGVALQKW